MPGVMPLAIVLIGVSGSGKSTIGKALAAALGATFLEGDTYHSAANVGKMRRGAPLDDADRLPWLAMIGTAIATHTRNGRDVVVSCSALKRVYRDRLRARSRRPLVFVHLDVDPGRLEARLQTRAHHFMPASLLASQLATLEPLARDEAGVRIMEAGTVRQTVSAIGRWLTARTRRGPQGRRAVTYKKEGGRNRPPF